MHLYKGPVLVNLQFVLELGDVLPIEVARLRVARTNEMAQLPRIGVPDRSALDSQTWWVGARKLRDRPLKHALRKGLRVPVAEQ